MTANASARTTTAPRFTDAFSAERRKLLALRLHPTGIALILLVSVGVGVFMTVIGDSSTIADAQAESEYAVIFYSSGLTTWAFVYLAANFVAIEFHGIGQSTFVATARRTRVLAAKLVLIGAGGLMVGLVASATSAVATQGMLALRGYEPLDLTDPGLIRAVVVLVGASMAVQGLIAAAFAVLTRSAVAGVVITGLISLVPVSMATFMGEWYSEHIPRWLPGAAVESLAGVAAPESYGYLPVPLAATAVIGWLAILLGAAVLRLPRMDIR
jgi:ABC-2 type transport system permease protein